MPIVGTCGNCGGPVQTPDMWGGVIPPTPTCMRCGATAATPYGPVMPMTPRRDDIEILEAAIRQAAKLTPNAALTGGEAVPVESTVMRMTTNGEKHGL